MSDVPDVPHVAVKTAGEMGWNRDVSRKVTRGLCAVSATFLLAMIFLDLPSWLRPPWYVKLGLAFFGIVPAIIFAAIGSIGVRPHEDTPCPWCKRPLTAEGFLCEVHGEITSTKRVPVKEKARRTKSARSQKPEQG